MSTKELTNEKQTISVSEIAITGVCIALTFIATGFINIRLPIAANGGLVHLGNVPLFFAAAFFGRRVGAICGGLGMALSDLLSGWTMWAPGTLIIVGLMGFVFGSIVNKKPTLPRLLAATGAVLAIKLVGYYVFEAIVTGNWAAPWLSVPGNIMQIITGAIIAIPIILVSGAAVKKLTKDATESN